MNIKNLLFIFLCLTMYDLTAKGSKKKSLAPAQTAQTQATTATAQQAANDFKKQQAQAAAAVFAPDMPTSSIHEKTIEQIYGATGLNIAKQDLTHIKNSYCYLEFLVKIDQVKNNTKYAQYQVTDFKDFMQPRTDNKALMPTQTLVQSAGWKAVEITAQDLIASAAWQNFIKAMICDSFDNDKDFIIDTTQTNNQIFPYIPNIETSYQTNDFISLRLYQESIQLQTLLQDQQRKQYLAQTTDWVGAGKLEDKITQFKKSDFYNFTHNAQATQPKKDPKTGAQNPVVIASPVREQIVCYFMLMHIQTTINDMLNANNAAKFLTQANSPQLAPNFFMYGPSDFVYIQDMLTLQTLSDEHAKNPKKSGIVMTLGTNEAPDKNAAAAPSAVPSTTPSVAPPAQQSPEEIRKQAAAIIFQKLPTASKYEQTIDKIYGQQGLKLTQDLIDQIKKTYCYLEFLVKIEKVKKDKKYKQYQKTDFKDFMQSKPGDNALMPTQTLVASAGWKAINYNDTDVTTNSAWQIFLKAMICDIYDTQDEFVLDLLTVGDQIVDDVANIEDSYTTDEFTQIRLVDENMLLDQVVLENQQKNYLEQCLDWKKLNQKDLIAAMIQFKKTDFYDLSHNSITSKTKEQAQQQYSSIASPTKEQIVSYYTLLSIQTEVYNLLTLENLASFLTTASSPELTPNFFAYTPSDYIYLYDNLMLNDLIDANKKALQDVETFDLNDADDAVDQHKNDDEVVIQSAANDLKKMNRGSAKSIKKMNAGTKKSLRKMNKATRRNVKKMNHIIAKRWKKNQKLILAVIITIVVVVAVVALVVCTAGAASAAAGAAYGAIGAAWSAGAATGGTLGGVAAVGSLAAAQTAAAVTGTVTAIGASAAATATATSAAFAAGGITGVATLAGTSLTVAALSAPLTAAMVAAGVGLGVAAAADHKFGMQMMAGMMTGMEAMTDALTTGFIGMSIGLTYLGAGIGQGLGFPVNAKAEMYKVKAKMEKYRGSINMAMSVVLTVIMTVAVMCVDAGLASIAMGAARSGLLGSTVSGVVLANDATMAAATVTAKEAALTVAKASVDDAAKAVTQATAKVSAASGQSAAEQKAAQEALAIATTDLAAKQAAVPAAQAALDAAKMAAEQTAVVATTSTAVTTATKNLAEKQATELAAQTAFNAGKGGSELLAQAIADRQAAQLLVEQTTQKATLESTKLTTLQASQKTEQGIAAMQAQADKPSTNLFGKSSNAEAKSAQLTNKVKLLKDRQLVVGAKQTAALQAQAVNTSLEKAAVQTLADQTASDALVAQNVAQQSAQQVTVKQTEKQIAQKELEEAIQLSKSAKLKVTPDNPLTQAAAKDASKQVALKKAAAEEAEKALTQALSENSLNQTSALAARQTAEQAAAKLAAQKSADRMATQAATEFSEKLAQSDVGKESARLAAQQESKLAAEKTAQQAQETAELAAQKETSAQAQQQAAQKTIEASAKKYSEKLAAINTEKQLAQKTVQDALTQEIEAQTQVSVARETLQTAQDNLIVAGGKTTSDPFAHAAEQGALKNLASAEKSLAAKQAATVDAKSQLELTMRKESDLIVEQQTYVARNERLIARATTNLTTKTATKTAALADQNVAQETLQASQQALKETTEKIVAKHAALIEGLTLSQQAQKDGLKTALKNNVMTGSFALGQIFNGVFGVFGIMAAAHQDEMAAQAAEEEKQSIQKLWKFVEDTKVNTTQTQQLFLDELHKKHQVAVENQAFGLQYYENFLNGSINNVQDQISQALAQQQIALLTPNNNGLRPADIGSTWGLQTAFNYLYPSQGFISTTLGRPDFPYAQEVAQAPLTSPSNNKTQTDLSDNSSADAKLWFNQKAITTLHQSPDMPLDVEIKLRIIYKLTGAYHVGLYLGGNYQDYNSPAYLQELQDTARIDIAQAHLAKMFVLKRDDKDAAPSVGVYEHEGKGWIARQPLDAKTIDTASIYHMRAHLEKDQLTVAFWQESNPSEKWSQTMTVKPTDQRTFGIIFSGVAVEWNVVKPILKIQENKTARMASNGQSEIARERASKAQWKKLMEPQLGFMKIKSLGRLALLQGHYLYTTQDTNLVDEKNNPITDYVIFANASGDQITNLGQSPQPTESGAQTPNAIVSLVTGNVYNASRKIIARKDNMLATYVQTNKLGEPILDEISLASDAYAQAQKAQRLAQQAKNAPQESIIASQTVSFADLINPAPPEVGGVQLGLTSAAPTKIVTSSVTISQLQNLAAGSAGLAL
jgi:hypothetical protein